MKQHITPSQANEVTFQDFCTIYQSELVYREDWTVYHAKKMTIGKLFQFLIKKSENIELIITNNHMILRTEPICSLNFTEKNMELIDILWKHVKSIIEGENTNED